MMQIDLSGKTALVTGASRGIGLAIARQLLRAGATVGLHCHRHPGSAQRVVAEFPDRAVVFRADLGQPRLAADLLAAAVAEFGRLDVLVNNAGVAIAAPLGGSDKSWLQVWEQTMAVNLTASSLLAVQAVRHFQKHGGGRIIAVASRAAFRGDTPEYLAYAASKGGMVALTRSIARGFGKQNIKAFIIAPGYTRTDMTRDFIARYGKSLVERDVALNRITEPNDIAPLVVLLASGLADHATGGTFDFNAASYFH